MSFNQGSIGFTSKNTGGGGGGGVLTMQNGLSLVGTAGELGLNPLLHNTAFDLATFIFAITNNLQTALILDGTPGSEGAELATTGVNAVSLSLSDAFNVAAIQTSFLGLRGLELDFGNDIYKIGDIINVNNGLKLMIDDFNKDVNIQNAAGNRFLDIDILNNNYQLGDINGTNNNVVLNIEDGVKNVNIQDASGTFFVLDMLNDIYKIGDTNGIFTGSELIIAGATSELIFRNSIGRYMDLFSGAGSYIIGDIDGTNNGLVLNLNDGGMDATIEISGGKRMLNLSASTGKYNFGDLDTILNGNAFLIDDVAQTFRFINAGVGGIFSASAAGIATVPPTGGGAQGVYQLGKVITAVSVLDAAHYVEVNIDGVLLKLALIT